MEITLTWRKLAIGAAVVSAATAGAAFMGAKLALATEGGETRNDLSFAGTLRTAGGAPVTSATMLTFTFRKGTTAVCAPSALVTPDSGGAFVAQIPMGACPRSLFDGSDVVFDVANGSAVIARDQVINPVPYARYADTVGTPDCPATYARDPSASGIVLCRRGNDQIVRVGTGNSAFWIDRYEASVWADREGTRGVFDSPTTPFGASGDDYPTSFPDNGQWTSRMYAVSRLGSMPSRFVTWFQAHEACAASGKRLPMHGEWLRAAHGTVDTGGSVASTCWLTGGGVQPSVAGRCESSWGAQDMIGNVGEFVANWVMSPGITPIAPSGQWGAGYSGDGTYYITSGAQTGSGFVSGLPAVLVVGGHASSGTVGGVFNVEATASPSDRGGSLGGFRCVTPR